MASGNPMHIFEAAVRFRSATSPPPLTGWEGSRDALAPLMRWMQEHPVEVGMDQEVALMGQRIANTMAASYGGWTHLDTLEMAALRAEMKTLERAKFDSTESRRHQAFLASPPADQATANRIFNEATGHAEREFGQSTDGRRLAELQAKLQSQVRDSARRELWQGAVILIVFLALWLGFKLLNR
jgi:hypothetical protein